MQPRRVVHVVEREWLVTRRLWRGWIFSAFVGPLLFLGAMGFGVGNLVDQQHGPVAGLTYLEFIAPALLAASVTMQAAGSSMWPVMGGVKWNRTYHAAVATPVECGDVYLGQLLWTATRGLMSAAAFLVVASLLGGVASPWGVLAIPAAVLGGLAIAAPLSAWAVGRQGDSSFIVVMRVVVFPLFLFSGTFFPVSQLPDWLEWLAFLSPLYHAVALCRAAAAGSADGVDVVGNVLVLLLFVAWGVTWGTRSFRRVLAQ